MDDELSITIHGLGPRSARIVASLAVVAKRTEFMTSFYVGDVLEDVGLLLEILNIRIAIQEGKEIWTRYSTLEYVEREARKLADEMKERLPAKSEPTLAAP